ATTTESAIETTQAAVSQVVRRRKRPTSRSSAQIEVSAAGAWSASTVARWSSATSGSAALATSAAPTMASPSAELAEGARGGGGIWGSDADGTVGGWLSTRTTSDSSRWNASLRDD